MDQNRITVALTGNPNVGKSTIFNRLTGMHQHTANWAGVTVSTAQGAYTYMEQEYQLVDLPGTYSLSSHSEEERVAERYLNSGQADIIALVCDATCLERGLRLLAQILALPSVKESSVPTVLCVNLCDEARRKGIVIDFELLEDVLQIPVVPCCGHCPASLDDVKAAIASAWNRLYSYDCLDFSPKKLAAETVRYTKVNYRKLEERVDRLVTGRFSGTCLLLLLLFFVFWLTMAGANYPSRLLWEALFSLEGRMASGLTALHAPLWFINCFVYGIYRVLAWVISVMLPPMAIFFPLFTLLEDLGYLPRAAFHMDPAFAACHSCGKQCLTMAMGLGCNAAGVTGCRIIDSPRERLIAILTNSLTPCNGRFPTLFTLITLFLAAGAGAGWLRSMAAALALTTILLVSISATMAASWLLSRTVLKGVPSSFTLELPPYRRPQIGRVILRSLFDRTLFVLGRAAAVAAPAGFLIWLLANVSVGSESLLFRLTCILDPLGRLMGLDGVILAAFLLGFSANEIVLPIVFMAYMQTGILAEMTSTAAMKELLTAHGWTWQTALSMVLFCLFHWPCSTTCLTIKKETRSVKWTALAVLLP
ncbi:MAG: ferrous iron transporter B, partial [Lachnospiraceae bacterium]|nr:ferrous iron transporter B [Lachnospiraceae bacterium]